MYRQCEVTSVRCQQIAVQENMAPGLMGDVLLQRYCPFCCVLSAVSHAASNAVFHAVSYAVFSVQCYKL